MQHFKNKELTESYRVALNTVLNWIKAAESGKLELELVREGERSYIANTALNQQTLERLATERKKYRNTRSVREISPQPQFYELYSEDQIFDVISSLEIHHEIPRKYNYFDGGATMWDKYVTRLLHEEGHNPVKDTIHLLSLNQSYLDGILKQYKRVNFIDIGPGNAIPTRPMLATLVERGILGRYIALEISPMMLDIAESNIQEWFGNKVRFEGKILDFESQQFKPLLAREYIENDGQDTLNLVYLWGGMLNNLRNPNAALQSIQNSMGRDDILLNDHRLDTSRSRKLIYANDKSSPNELPSNHRLMFDLLGIDSSFYRVEMGFEPMHKFRYIQARLQVALRIKFKFASGERSIELEKGDAITVYRYWHRNTQEIIDLFIKNDLYPLHVSQTEDREFLLMISRVDADISLS